MEKLDNENRINRKNIIYLKYYSIYKFNLEII